LDVDAGAGEYGDRPGDVDVVVDSGRRESFREKVGVPL
jgi:hypothetical protein